MVYPSSISSHSTSDERKFELRLGGPLHRKAKILLLFIQILRLSQWILCPSGMDAIFTEIFHLLNLNLVRCPYWYCIPSKDRVSHVFLLHHFYLHWVPCINTVTLNIASLVYWGPCIEVASLVYWGPCIEVASLVYWGPCIEVASLVYWGPCIEVASLV